ncbi:MAG: zf-HC2 domain-containing protein [Gammaproteobacteria bacterium]
MTTSTAASSDRAEHIELESLLPWYANGTLEKEERERVRRHLESCELCVQALNEWRNVATHVRREGTTWQAPTGQLANGHVAKGHFAKGHFARIMANVEEPRAGPRRSSSPGARWHEWFKGWRLTPVPVRWALAGQTALLIALAVLLFARTPAPAVPEFVTLSDPISGVRAPGIQIIFAGDLTHEQLFVLLDSVGAQIVSGPSRMGVYNLALAAPERLEQALLQLREHSGVELAEPVELPFTQSAKP